MTTFSEVLNREMNSMARETLESQLVWMRTTTYGTPSQEIKEWATEKVGAMTDKQVWEVLEATASKPCPECGR